MLEPVSRHEIETAAREARARAQETRKKKESEFHDLSRLCASTGNESYCNKFNESWGELMRYYNVINGVRN